MMENLIKILIMNFIVIFALGCMQQDVAQEKDMEKDKGIMDVKIINFETDKETYSSHETLKATIQIDNAIETEIKARLAGIKPHNYAHIDETRTLNLSEGKNTIVFSAQTPHCTSGCGGVYPGPYDLTIELIEEGKVIANSTKTIELVR